MTEHTPCKYEEVIMEMSGDIKTLVSEVKHMNGKLIDTKTRFDKHDDESIDFRRKVDIVWAVVHSAKWVIILIFGSGFLWKFLEWK